MLSRPFLTLFLLLPSSLAVISTITVSSSPTPTPASSSYNSLSQFQLDLLTAHNHYRSEHNASALRWNSSLASYASDYAKDCQFKHSGGSSGENLAAGYANATAAVDAWGDERGLYDFLKQGFSKETGHFTQVVWKATEMVGCGRVDCEGRNEVPGWYVVCEYYPPGNVVGQYLSNVQSQLEEGIRNIVGDKPDMEGGDHHDQGEGQDTRGGGQYIQGGVNDGVTLRRASWVGVLIGVGMVLLIIKC